MAIVQEEFDRFSRDDDKTLVSIKNSLSLLDEKFDLRWKHQDMQFKNLDEKFRTIDGKFSLLDKRMDGLDLRLDKLEGRFWQIVMVLIGYPIALLVGKLCHII